MIEGKMGSVGCGMDFPCFGKTELIGDWKENFDDCERSFLF